ncbi:uncharacterized protein LOC141651750 [Silene latifolia]|uniref:uncharacterized protein LOC141651750 n=1 Tax=Silene latifolia TaxID=37657 RepID=UPI003D77B8F5
MFKEIGVTERMNFMMGCWAIWERRNKAVFDDGEWRADWVVRRAKDLFMEMRSASMKGETQGTPGGMLRGGGQMGTDGGGSAAGLEEKWARPREGICKVNVDAGFIKGKGVGWGLVCRGISGMIDWAITIQEQGEIEPKVAEAITVYHGICEARRIGVKDVIIESDCLNVCRKLNSVAHALTHYSPWHLDFSNGAPMGKVDPCCGIRQGDPLSPYIFALCTEVLSQMILYAQDGNLIKGIKICKNGPEISHLLFADDSLFFIRGDFGELDFLMNIIDEYCVASGQCLNKDKSSLLFSPNCSLMTVKKCLTEFKFAPKHDLGNYLGLPTSIGSSKRDLFKYLVDKTKRRLSSWNNILLSSAGKLTLIRSVLSSLSLFSLSVFRIPVSVTSKLQSLMVHFWWSGTRTNKSIHWCSKEFLSRPVGEGGLGLRNIGCFNQALLAKSAWRILCVPGSLISKVIGPKLGVQDDFLFKDRWKASQASSWALKSLVWGSDLIYNNIAWTIGSSSRLNAWKSKWIEGYSLHDLCGDVIEATSDSTLLVGDLHDNHRRWDLSSLGFDPGEGVTKKILATYIPFQPSDDSFYWKFSKHGGFTVKSGYYAAAMALSNGPISNVDRSRMSAPIVTFCKSKLWKLPISNKLKVFLWKFMANALPVGSEFLKRKMDWQSSCSLCDESSPCVESISHLFRDCSFAKALWFGCPLGLRITGGVDIDARVWVINWVTYFLIGPDPNSLLFPLIATLWRIWCCRNEMVFKKRRPWPLSALNSILGDIQCMKEAVSSKDVSLLRAPLLDCSPAFGLAKRIRNSFPYWIVGGPGCENVCTIKCDAAWRADRSSGMGWCLFDGNGTLRNTAHARSFASSALHAEGNAAIMALKWALDEGYLHVRLVTDCLILVMRVLWSGEGECIVKCIIHDLKSIASHFHCCSLNSLSQGGE